MQRCRCFFNLLRRVNETEYFQITRQAPELNTGAILWLSLRRHIVRQECEREVRHTDDCGLCVCPYPFRGHRRTSSPSLPLLETTLILTIKNGDREAWRAMLPGKSKLDDVFELRKKIAEAKPLEERTEPYVLRGRNN